VKTLKVRGEEDPWAARSAADWRLLKLGLIV